MVAVLFSPLLGAGVRLPGSVSFPKPQTEAMTRLPVTRLWWIPASVAPRAEAEGPDLASWYQVRMTLREIVSELQSESPPSMRQSQRRASAPRRSRVWKTPSRGNADCIVGCRLVLATARIRIKQPGNGYRETQRVEEAEASYSESLAIYRRLAEDNPNIYLPGLASSLGNLATMAATSADTRRRCHWQRNLFSSTAKSPNNAPTPSCRVWPRP